MKLALKRHLMMLARQLELKRQPKWQLARSPRYCRVPTTRLARRLSLSVKRLLQSQLEGGKVFLAKRERRRDSWSALGAALGALGDRGLDSSYRLRSWCELSVREEEKVMR